MTKEKKPKKHFSCFSLSIWTILLVLVLILVVFFVASSLFHLGIWEEFWNLFR